MRDGNVCYPPGISKYVEDVTASQSQGGRGVEWLGRRAAR
jgi:hypothetical protein